VKLYKVVSLADNTGAVNVEAIAAKNPHSAMQKAARALDFSSEVQIICAIPFGGFEVFFCPCEDAGKAAYASDLDSRPICVECRERIGRGPISYAKDGAAFHQRCWSNV
jgi:hypothetical protein